MKIRDLVLTALFAAVTAVCAQLIIPIPISPVPFSVSILAVFLSGAVLKKKQAAYAQLVYVLLGAAGIPVFGGFSGGLSYILGPTGGYILAYPVMAFIVAYIAEKTGKKSFPVFLFGMLCALAACYIMGTAWLSFVTKMPLKKAVLAGVLPFVLTDIFKVGLSAALGVYLNRALKRSQQ